MKLFVVLGSLVMGSLGLQCEYYNRKVCEKEWKEQNKTLAKFAGDPADLLASGSHSPACWMASKTCSPKDTQCFATWSPLDETESADAPDSRRSNFAHRSGHQVELMGCIGVSDKCHDTLCHATERASAAKVYFCCCKEDLCNQNFTHSVQPVQACFLCIFSDGFRLLNQCHRRSKIFTPPPLF